MRHGYNLLICCFTLILLSATGCGKITEQSDYVIPETETENVAESVLLTSVIFDELEFHVPSLWTIQGNVMLSDDMPVLSVEINTFDESKLKEEFLYESTEECVRSFLPNGVYLQSDTAKMKEINGLSIYEFVCTADKYSKSEDRFVMSDDIVYLDYIIQSEVDKIYCLYFMNGMAEENKIELFLENVQKSKTSNDNDGEYRWMSAN